MTYRTYGGTPDVVATDASGSVTAAPALKVYTTRTGSTQPALKDTSGNPVTTVSPISSGLDLGLVEFQADADGFDYLWLDRQDGSRRMRVALRDPAVADLAGSLAGKASKKYAFTVDTDYASLEDAYADTAVGGTLEIRGQWSRVLPFTTDKTSTVRMTPTGSITMLSASATAIRVSANDVFLDRPRLFGTGSSTSDTGTGISAVGTLGAPITGLRIRGPKCQDFTQYGIYLEFCTDFRVERVRVDNVTYAGVMLLSCVDGEVDGGVIKNVTMAGGLTNAYGLAASRRSSSASELAAYPRSENIAVRNLTVDGVPGWEGLDTHGGKDISFINCTVRNCKVPIALVPSPNNAGTNTYAPIGALVQGCKTYSGVTDGSRSNGIQIVGTSAEQATGAVIGNLVCDAGTDNATAGSYWGGIYVEQTLGFVVANNTIKRPTVCGVQVYQGNTGLLLAGNTVEDVWATAAAVCAAVYVRSSPNVVTIGGTQIVRGSKTGTTLVNNEGLRCNTSSTQVDAGGNQWANAVTPVVSGATALVASFYGAPPVARAGAIASPSTPSATYQQAEAASMKTAVDAIRTALKNIGITL